MMKKILIIIFLLNFYFSNDLLKQFPPYHYNLWKELKKGTIKVDKNSIWDNSYYVTRPPELDDDKAIKATSFKGCKKGWDELILLIRQTK